MEETGNQAASIINSIDVNGQLTALTDMLAANAPLVVGVIVTFTVIVLTKRLLTKS